MSYLGNAPESVFTEMKYQDLTGGSGTSFTLNQAVSNPQEIEVFVNNVRQEPSAAYSVSGTTLTMTESVGASEDFYVVFQGMAQGSATHPATQSLEAASVTSNGNIKIPLDGSSTTNQIAIGASDDLRIFHNGNASYVYDAGTGSLQIVTNNLEVRGNNFARKMISANDQGTVELYHNNSKKFETTSVGVGLDQVFGLSDTDTGIALGANGANIMQFYTGNNEQMRIDANGYVNINQTSGTGGVLNVSNATGTWVATLVDAVENNNFVEFRDSGGNQHGYIKSHGSGLKVNVGNVGGIDFSAGSSASGMTSELLDDYEEGAFTPFFSAGITSAGYSSQVGTYVKVGAMVICSIKLRANSGTENSNHIRIGGLPFAFTSATDHAYGGFFTYNGGFWTSDVNVQWLGLSGNTTIAFYQQSNGGSIAGTNSNVAANLNADCRLTVVYRTDS